MMMIIHLDLSRNLVLYVNYYITDRPDGLSHSLHDPTEGERVAQLLLSLYTYCSIATRVICNREEAKDMCDKSEAFCRFAIVPLVN